MLQLLFLSILISLSSTESSGHMHSAIYGHRNFEVQGSACRHSCLHVAFHPHFQNLEPSESVHVQAGIGFRDRAPNRIVLSTWIRGVTPRGFHACAGASGFCGPLSLSVEWFAYISDGQSVQDNSSGLIEDAVVKFSNFTTQKLCHREHWSDMNATYKLATALRSEPESVGADGAFLWIEKTNESRVCYKEAQIFSGLHTGYQANILMFNHSGGLQDLVKGADAGQLVFSKKHFEGNSVCQTVRFQRKYYRNTRPTVLASPTVLTGSRSAPEVAVVAWTESANKFSVNLCVQVLPPSDVLVTWAAIGTIDPCVGVTCELFGVCADTGPRSYECVAPSCDSSIDEPVCASDGVSYDNECEYHRFVFNTRRSDIVIYHRGRCNVFPFQRGNGQIEASRISTSYACKTVQINSNLFYPDKRMEALATPNFHTATDSTFVHDVPTLWIDNLTSDNMTVCVYIAGRGERHATDQVSFTWFVYQGAPDGALGGVVNTETWLTGTTCTQVNLAMTFDSPPNVLATLRHSVPGVRRDAATLWTKDVGTQSFSLCVRELQNFDGAHENVSINWLALPTRGPRVFLEVFSDFGLVRFAGNDLTPSRKNNYAFCKTVQFSRNFSQVPSVLVTPRHNDQGNALFLYDNIVAWVEEIISTEFRVCAKEIQVRKNGYDPLSVNYVVLPYVCDEGWLPHDGYCYEVSAGCNSWTVANSTCEQKNSSLASIHNDLEAYFIGVLSSGESWIGLYGNGDGFNWTDGTAVDYVHWPKEQLALGNYSTEQVCVNELGVKNLFHWNGTLCKQCLSYVCKKDLNECETGSHGCSNDAVCTNEVGSFSCTCKHGYVGNGRVCTPNECFLGKHNCHANAVCRDTDDGFTCTCKPGFHGDGTLCGSCPSGYSVFKNRRCYKYFSTSVTWSKARQQCLTDGGDLVSIANQEEYTYVQNLYSSGEIWLGLNDIAWESNFVWSDGSPVTFTKWDSTEPNDAGSWSGEDCAHTLGPYRSSLWNDLSCSKLKKFVCQVSTN
ncbi:uncharacterized protein [Oscarella lobularis]|uniref:uncharacterized protein n=1 Tax=Oscarella lobularis TaxID=121494 RepID=UPI0033137621